VIDVGERDTTGFSQTIGDGLRRKARPMLDAAESLLFDRGHQNSISNEGSRGVAMECIETEDDH